MIKTTDKKPVVLSPAQQCFEESAEPSLGIAFCRKDGVQRFACYSFLSTVDFDGNGEMIFSFTSWKAAVRGESLQPLWKATRGAFLAVVREADVNPQADLPHVRQIVFEEISDQRC